MYTTAGCCAMTTKIEQPCNFFGDTSCRFFGTIMVKWNMLMVFAEIK